VKQTFHASIFSCKATTKSFTGPKKGSHPDVDAAVLHFMKETHAKGMQVKATETARSLGITNFKAGEVGVTDSCIVKDCHSGIKHPFVKRFKLIFKRSC
jgi:hypothetical protein